MDFWQPFVFLLLVLKDPEPEPNLSYGLTLRVVVKWQYLSDLARLEFALMEQGGSTKPSRSATSSTSIRWALSGV